MPATDDLILGEFHRTVDERYRLSVPAELMGPLTGGSDTACVLVKEQAGSLSLWRAETWRNQLDNDVQVVRSKIQAMRLQQHTRELQLLGRLLSTRHRDVQITGRGRLLIPEGFREFLGIEPGGEVMVVGAAICVEVWNPHHWIDHLQEKMPDFNEILSDLIA